MFLGLWFVYAFLITTYYKTSLTAALAVPFVPPTIDTLQQLIRSNLDFGMIDAKVAYSCAMCIIMSIIRLYSRVMNPLMP